LEKTAVADEVPKSAERLICMMAAERGSKLALGSSRMKLAHWELEEALRVLVFQPITSDFIAPGRVLHLGYVVFKRYLRCWEQQEKLGRQAYS
jgi:hypothetical protein